MAPGYYRFPTIFKDTVVFVCEDDLWVVSVEGGIPRRLTAAPDEESSPRFSPDGQWLAFTGQDEGGKEVYVMPALGGAPQRLTYVGGDCDVVGWTRDGRVIFASAANQPFSSITFLYTVAPNDLAQPQRIPCGPARAIAYGPRGGAVIGRNTGDPARWKRYRGGMAGRLWIDVRGDGGWKPLIELDSNLASPMWLDDNRIYFISDYEGVGNLYSCTPNGKQLRRHTAHRDFYVRNATTDGQRIVYHAGADLYVFDPVTGHSRIIPIEWRSPQTQRQRKFSYAGVSLDGFAISPKGDKLAITTRGKLYTFYNHEGAVMQHGATDGVRYRLPVWTSDETVLAITDEGGEETWQSFTFQGDAPSERAPILDTGRITAIKVNPVKGQIAFTNHRYELIVYDHESETLTVVDRGVSRPIQGFDWSPDGEWLAYDCSISLRRTAIKLWRSATGQVTQITDPVLADVKPAFDPAGKYLFFLSSRVFSPVYDNLQFELSFPRGMIPCLITLQRDMPSPFIPLPPKEKDEDDEAGNQSKEDRKEKPSDGDKGKEKPKLVIDLDGIQKRVLAFPVREGLYRKIAGASDGKRVFYTSYTPESVSNDAFDDAREPPSRLKCYDLESRKEEDIAESVRDFALSANGQWLVYSTGARLRVLKVGAQPTNDGPSRKTGWIDLGRVNVSVNPAAEWRQMFREAWRLQRDQFWTPDMSQVDWKAVYEAYLPLVERVSSRSEFSDLMWEMQGELGTSHCYEYGGDYRHNPRSVSLGRLGAEFEWDDAAGVWRIVRIAQGDTWFPKDDSPLNAPGVDVRPGDHLLAINGVKLMRKISPNMLLVNQAGVDVALTVSTQNQEPRTESQAGRGESGVQGETATQPTPYSPLPNSRVIIVKTLYDDRRAWYRDWVERNRRRVHEATGGRAGYVHIPDMMPRGFAEFHRGFLAELERDALIVDVRYNSGGHVSQLILEKLARKRIGYDVARWAQTPIPYPEESVLGPLVAIANEYAGSDGDVFAHGFKALKLGPLIGMRTWGGVIGISPQHTLTDGTITTQPEFALWFHDVDWRLENYGAEPDIVVDNTPQDWVNSRDAQLERAIAEILRLLEANPPRLPTFDARPIRAAPRLR
ncbi:MAG: tricorn protease [Candidatus Roseilinea sp.]|nr:MAG: tricorn protease [Candidatus Roseilinea sp.]